MKAASAGLIAHLQQEVTTLTTCWELKRRDGRFFRFTDNVVNLTVDGAVYRADVGYSRTAIANSANLSVDNLQVDGVFDGDTITEKDLRDGLFDFAEVRIFLVNHQDLAQGILRMRRGTLGEVQSIPAGQFMAELRGMAQRMQQVIGNLYQPTCRAQLGGRDRCKFPVDPPVVVREAAYEAGDFVKAHTGNPTSVLLSVSIADGDLDALTGWTTESGSPSIVASQDGLGPAEGAGFLTAGGADFVISQTVDLTAIVGFNAADLDSGFYEFQASIRRATTGDGRHSGRVRVEALDSAGEVLAELWNTGYEMIRPSAVWVLRGADSVSLPAGTRSLRFYLEAGNQLGTGSKAAFDNLVAEIVDNDGQTGSYAFYENRIYECTSAGVTSAVEPSFDAVVGNTTVDGGVTWTTRESFTRNASVLTATSNSVFTLSITSSAAGSVDDWFNGGEAIFETGANAGLPMEVRDYVHSSKQVTLFLPMPNQVAVGDKLRLVPGCNRTRAHCRDKFRIPGGVKLANGNMKEYDGEPDVPGPDAILTYPDAV